MGFSCILLDFCRMFTESVVDHNAFLKHNICIQSFSGNNAVSSFCLIIKSKTLNISHNSISSVIVFTDDFFVCIPDRSFYSISRHNFHKIYRMLYISIQWENFQDSFQNFRYAMSVTAIVIAFFPRILQESFRQNTTTIAVSHFA